MGTTSSKLEEYSGNSKLVGIGTSTNGSKRDSDNHFQMEKEKSEVVMSNGGTITRVPKAEEGEQIAAGWPSWLASVAGEAINGWVPRRADSFEKFDKEYFCCPCSEGSLSLTCL